MRKAAGIAAICLLILVLLLGCEAAVVEAETATPLQAATPAPSRTPIPLPPYAYYTPEPRPAPTPIPTPSEPEWSPSPIHPDLLPMVVYDYHYKERENPKPTPNNAGESPKPILREIPLKPNDQPEFGREDLIAGDLRAGMTQEEVLAILGLPAEVYAYTDEMYVIEHLDLFYENGDNVMFWAVVNNTYDLNYVEIISDLEGPRGLRVGDMLEDVLSAFRIDEDYINGPETEYGPLLYAGQPYNPNDSSHWAEYVIPPSGGINLGSVDGVPVRNSDTVYIYYDYIAHPYTYADLEESEHYLYSNHPFASFECRDGRVVCYRWGY